MNIGVQGMATIHGICRLVSALLVVILVAGSNPSLGASAPLPQTPRGAASIVVSLDKPTDRGSYPSNAFVPVSATIASVRPVTSAELWVNGVTIATRKPVGFQNRYSAHFSWQPGTTGDHTVIVRAVDDSGAFADSPPVRIVATGVVTPRMLLENSPGETLRSIAGRLNVTADQLAGLNPGIAPDQPLAPGSSVFAPLRSEGQAGSAPPTATVTPSGVASQRGIPAVAMAASNLKLTDGKLLADTTIDKVYYYVSIGQGEWRRYPEDPNSFVMPMNVDDLKSWAKSGSPELNDRRAFDVAGKLGNLRAISPQGETEFYMEAWGWRAGELVYLGGFQKLISADLLPKPNLFLLAGSDLLGCVSGTSCMTSDTSFGWRSNDLSVEQDGIEKVKFLLKTSASGWTGSAVWQVSTVPFSGGFDPAPPGLVATGVSNFSSFDVDFSKMKVVASAGATPEPTKVLSPAQVSAERPDGELANLFNSNMLVAPTGQFAQAQSSLLQAASKALSTVTYYVRATPMAGNQAIAAPSNSIKVLHVPKSDSPGVEILNPNELLPGIFDLQVLDFQTFNPSSSGCAQIVRNEHTAVDSVFYQVGKTYCPAPFKGLGGKPWYEQLVDFVASGVDWIARAYDSVKRGVVAAIAFTIPGCSGSDICKGVLSAGLDMAMIYAGVPPSLPSFAQLEDIGQAALIDNISDQLGIPCGPGSLCQDGINAALAGMKEQALAGGSNEACLPEAEARALGFEPMCLPAGVIGIPVEGSMPHPASMRVRVTRKVGSPEVSDEVYARYQLGVGVTGINSNYPVGNPVKLPVNYPRDSSTYALLCGMWPDEASITLSSPLSGTLFRHPASGVPVTIMPSNRINPVPAELTGPPALPVTVPRLKPGESQDLIIPLSPSQPFWVPGHEEAIKKAGGAVCFDDWYRLYQGGHLTASVEVSCSPKNQWMTCKLDQPAVGKLEMDMPW